jgi:hypothetical protein
MGANISVLLLSAVVVSLSSCIQNQGNIYTISTDIDTLKIPASERLKSDAAIIFYENRTGIGGEKIKRLTKEEYTILKQIQIYCYGDTLLISIGKNCCDSGYTIIRVFKGLFDYSYHSPLGVYARFIPTGLKHLKGMLKLSKQPTGVDGEQITGEFEGFFFYTASSYDEVTKKVKMRVIFKGLVSKYEALN